ncbi:hypothetical protein OOT46_10915 [Aquabacterium sp. A7-Y]|uniref:alpha/beta fold hydrolase n=1 Tax=Aquabacterium sp. A7-Y TaxID=1349605 RepID=UPI00223E3714|nr:alpha/beta fold hydrolase [Aquabacterium sp. A7-Y]MCW7538350.1 hypothetical protein [Aquabacterium sp. A7-Y]
MAPTRPTLVLLPGLDGTAVLFRPLLASLPADLRVRPLSYPTERRLNLGEYADWVEAQWPEGETVVLAESFSGLVALELLRRGCPRIAAWLFVACFAEPPRPCLLDLASRLPGLGSLPRIAPAALLRRFCVGADAGPATLALLREALNAVPATVLESRMALLRTRSKPPHRPVAVPCRYLQANGDRLVPAAAARWFSQHLSDCAVQAIDGPHFLLQTRPQACAAWIIAQLDELAGRRRLGA